MRIIGGEARGRRLVAPSGTDTRPTADKTRESLFAILMRDVPGADVLDLFGGTGALALEAMSRGANSAVICDNALSAIKAIEANVQTVMKGKAGVRVIRADYKSALKSLQGEKFDLIFLDPPYKMREAYTLSMQAIRDMRLLREDGQIIAERLREDALSVPEGYMIRDERIYRDTAIDFLIPAAPTEEAT